MNTDYLSNLEKLNILVVGDVMLDKYWISIVDRVSPEAPVAIANIQTIENRPGGAANVARNITSLGANVTVLSVIGQDEDGVILKQLLYDNNVKTKFIESIHYKTTVKIRIVTKHQQLIRADFESNANNISIIEEYIKLIDKHDLVVISDYGKGVAYQAKEMIEIANKRNKFILIDPKGKDYQKYSNANIITPNLNEILSVLHCGKHDMLLHAKKLRLLLHVDHILVTLGENGMVLINNDVHELFATAYQVYDVSGAGDTVIAVLSLMIANNVNIVNACGIANIAAGIVVEKFGTSTVTLDELNNAITKHNFLIDV